MKVITSMAISFAIIGAGLAFHGINAEIEDKKNDKWVTTPAVITQKFIRLKGTTEPYSILQEAKESKNSQKKDSRLFIPEIRFIYYVDGKKYGGKTIGSMVYPVPKEIAKKIISTYYRGRKVTAFYNKENFEEAVLFRRYQDPKQTTVIGFLAIIISMAMLWLSNKFSNKNRKKRSFYSSLFSKKTPSN